MTPPRTADVIKQRRELTAMTSGDSASRCDPRNRNGRMLVGSTANSDTEVDAVSDADMHSTDDDDDEDDASDGGGVCN